MTKPPAVPALPPKTQQIAVPIEKRTLTAPPPPKLEFIKKSREQQVEDNGKRLVVKEPNGRTIVKQDNRIIIHQNESERFTRLPNAQTHRRNDGVVETFYVRPDGVRVVTEVDSGGRLLRRYRRAPDGREFVIIDNRRFVRNVAIGVGITALAVAVAINLPPPRVVIPRERYIVEYERATPDDIYEALSAPPVERLERAYSLEEVRYSYALRQRMRRIDLDGITFDSGSAEISPEQYPKLERLARVILRVLERNPEEVLLIEGHTDAVGSDIDNLSLSDRRAESVAQVLTDVFQIPPENLVTQGYGEQHLKIPTQGPERLNRRVALRRISPLLAERQ
ncbi:MAG: OmpA family protein [Hyphomicrobiaceae bacterium]|nr:MAG: OmpA family protein [Hyphomicrobiaceae bacterium]